jgi:hypothetical protein
LTDSGPTFGLGWFASSKPLAASNSISSNVPSSWTSPMPKWKPSKTSPFCPYAVPKKSRLAAQFLIALVGTVAVT